MSKLLLSECATLTYKGVEFDCVQVYICDSESGCTYTTDEIEQVNITLAKLTFEVEHEQ